MEKNKNVRKHEHAGMSSVKFLDSSRILKAVGLEKGQVVVDIGSGAGYFSLAAASSVGMEGKVYAIDADEEAILTLKRTIQEQNIPNLKALLEDVTRHISVPKKSIDVCLMVNVLHGFVVNQEVDDVFRTLEPALREGAKLIVIDFKKHLKMPGPPEEIRLSPEEIESILARHGFVSERVFEAGPFHFGQVLKKGKSCGP